MDQEPPAGTLTELSTIFKTFLDQWENLALVDGNFESSLELCVVRLELAVLRLSRWGVSMGLLDEPSDSKYQTWSEPKVKKMVDYIERIQAAYGETDELSQRTKSNSSSADLSTVAEQPFHLDDSDARLRKLAFSVRNITRQRAKVVRTEPKSTCSRDYQPQLEELTETTSDWVNRLVDIGSEAIQAQQILAGEEAKSIASDSECLQTALDVFDGSDELLRSAIFREMKPRGRVFKNVHVSGTEVVRLGNTYGDVPVAKGFETT